MWVVRKVFRINRQGEQVLLMPGDEIPEAATFSNRDFWVRRGYFQEIARPTKLNPVTIEVSQVRRLSKTKLVLIGDDESGTLSTIPVKRNKHR